MSLWWSSAVSTAGLATWKTYLEPVARSLSIILFVGSYKQQNATNLGTSEQYLLAQGRTASSMSCTASHAYDG